MKGALRLAALMHLPVIHVFTHDSIGLGEDGPTHQPIEQLAHLRATPNVNVVRPADANETALAWQFALEQTDGPCALVLSRQGMPIIDPDRDPRRRDLPRRLRAARGVQRWRPRPDPDRHRVRGLDCLEAAELLEGDGVSTRVVSMPCYDRFLEQEAAYADAVLPPSCRARVSVEAAATFGGSAGWGPTAISVGMNGFGASAPQPVLYEHFGFTPENIAERGKAVVERAGAAARS